MRWSMLVLMVMLTIVGIAWRTSPSTENKKVAHLEVHAVHDEDDGWRQTSKGWQRMSRWKAQDQRSLLSALAVIHPLLLGSMELLISVGALVAFSSSSEPPAPRLD